MSLSYLMVTSRLEGVNGKIHDAHVVAKNRLKRKEWAIYAGTSFKDKIAPGDSLFFYIGKTAAKFSGFQYSILAKADVISIRQDRRMNDWFEMEDFFVDEPYKILNLGNIKILEKPFSIKRNLKKLDLVNRSTTNWGAYMQGGCKRLTPGDTKLLNKLF